MTDPLYRDARARMVREQLVERGIRDPRVLEAMAAVPRHAFVPAGLEEEAYADHPLRIGLGQTISQPYMVAVMTEMLAPQPADRILEIGTGSGYQTAILAQLAGQIFTIERHRELAESAELRLRDLGVQNVTVVWGDGSLGYAERAPYDGILVTAGSPVVPPPLIEQLAIGGRIVCPAGGRDLQTLYKVERREDGAHLSSGVQCTFVPLVGESAWPADPRL